ncbi:MAG: CHASE2 domain-containing protein [Muribaculaceae bacterium]|nr:CHASE2 domain-containing protein [Muribaculaceae bacterium]
MKLLKYIFHIDHLLITLLAFALTGLTYYVVLNFSMFDPLEEALGNMSSTDLFFRVANKGSDVNQDITIVDIGNEYNRGNLARGFAKIDSLKPWVTGIDVVFADLRGEPDDNMILLETVTNMSENTVWGTRLLDYDGKTKAFTGKRSSFFADTLGVREGFTNLDDNFEHKTIRNMLTVENLGDMAMNSFPVEIALVLDSLSLQPQKKLTIDFTTKFVVVPLDSVDAYKELISDHIVMVGSCTDEGDMWSTPLGKMPGVMLQAYSVETIRSHRNISYANTWVNLLIAFVLCYLFELIVDSVLGWLKRSKKGWCLFGKESNLVLRVVTIVFLFFVLWGILLMFVHKSVYLDAILILLLLGFVLESRSIYNAAIETLSRKHNWWLLRNTLINK